MTRPDPLGVECYICCAPIGYPCRTELAMSGGYIRNLRYGLVSRDGFWSSRLRPHAARVRAAREREEETK